MAWFWQLRGRLMGGVFVIMAPPGEGKSYVATAIALELMYQGVKVFSNFPILSVDGQYCSYEFKKEYMTENLNGCAVFIDEGYVWFSSRKYMEFTDDDHQWFATSGHNEMMIFIIVQNINRVDKVIREVLNLLYVVEKVKIPIIDLPLWFTVNAFLDVDDLKFFKMGFVDPYSTERFRFTVDVALAYDTKFFRKESRPPFKGKTWIDVYEEAGYEFVPVQLNILQKIKYRSGRKITSWLVYMSRILMKMNRNLNSGEPLTKHLNGIMIGSPIYRQWKKINDQRKMKSLWTLWQKWESEIYK